MVSRSLLTSLPLDNIVGRGPVKAGIKTVNIGSLMYQVYPANEVYLIIHPPFLPRESKYDLHCPFYDAKLNKSLPHALSSMPPIYLLCRAVKTAASTKRIARICSSGPPATQ